MNLDIKIYMHFPWHCGLLCCYLEKFAKSMHLLQTLLYWLCIYTYLSFVTLPCISSWFISSLLQWSGLYRDKYVVCWYTFWEFCQSCPSFPWFVLQSWWSVLCPDFLQFVFLIFLLMYMYIDLCFYALKSTNDC